MDISRIFLGFLALRTSSAPLALLRKYFLIFPRLLKMPFGSFSRVPMRFFWDCLQVFLGFVSG